MSATFELVLDAIAHGGEAIGRHGGKAIFVPYAIPGERVLVELVEEKERWARARLVEVLDPSPDRVAPPCPHFGPEACGGCQWQHIAYPRQAELKQAIVADQLRRLGRIATPPVTDIIALGDPMQEESAAFLEYGYRNQTHFILTKEGRLAFRQVNSFEPFAIERCLLLVEQLDALVAALDLQGPDLTGVTMRAGLNSGEALILFDTAAEEQPELELDLPAAVALRTPRGLQPLIGEPYVFDEIDGRSYRISAESGFPANSAGAAALVEVVRELAAVQAGDVVVDAYCGVGLFAVALAEVAGEVIGIDASPSACEDFEANAVPLENVSLHEGAVEEVLPALLTQAQHADAVLLSPPRTGAGKEVLTELAALGPRVMVYVSTDPATLARDAVHLIEAGYRLVTVQPIDLHPQTARVESVSRWEKREM